jgi:Ca2+-binding RTX toxin-like protein
MVRHIITALTIAGATLLAEPAQALQLVDNWSFEADILGWNKITLPGTVAHDATRDVDGYASSGSLEMANAVSDVMFGGIEVDYCIDQPPPAVELFAGAKVRYREGETAEGRLLLNIASFSGPGCTGSLVDGFASPYAKSTDGRGEWRLLRNGTAKQGTLLTGVAASFGLRLIFVKVEDTDLVTVNVDDVFLAPVGTPTCDGLPATQVGTGGDDPLTGFAGRDVIVGRGGSDTIDGKGGNDVLCGNAGADLLIGGPGSDRLFGGPGGDELKGGGGADLLMGQGGDDRLRGGGGSDDLIGGSGTDVCAGGKGVDLAASCETVTGVP